MKIFTGFPHNLAVPLLGKVSKKKVSFGKSPTFYVAVEAPWGIGHIGYLTSVKDLPVWFGRKPCLTDVPFDVLSELREGDIIKIFPDGKAYKVWEERSHQNVIFVTDRCDCRCIMCPQPPDPNAPPSRWQENRKILSMVNPKTSNICFTGGEPTLEFEQLVDLLAVCKKRFPSADLTILTNGKRFADFEKTKQLVEIGNKNVLFCVSLNGDTEDVHDQIVGVKGSFGQVIRGLYNLARFKQAIELRFVIMKQNFERLPYYAEFLYRNLPFVSHVAFMGLEYTGDAAKNLDIIRIDPTEYTNLLREAIIHLHRRQMNVSIFNVPKCLLPRDIWCFAKDSISSWKKSFLEECFSCQEKEQCCGIFATSIVLSKNIKPIGLNRGD